jgi:pimeloyl-ACP methyl ester carboxylesterase
MVNPLVAAVQRPVLRRRHARRLAVRPVSGVYEQRFVTVNGCEQWVTIRGADRANPVLLILHGGPGSSYTPFSSWITEWEEHFTVVQWDQPGAGRTFQRNGGTHPGGLTLARLASDGIEVVTQLCTLLGCRKVILLGSSVGSLVGVQMAQRRPDLCHAYVGVNQNSPGSDPLVYRLVGEAARHRRDRKGLRLLDEIGADPARWTADQHEELMKLAIKLTSGAPNMVYDLMLPALMFAPHYTMKDIRDYQRAMAYSLHQLFAELQTGDRSEAPGQFAVGVCIVMGAWDMLTPVATARQYFEKLHAPRKEFVIIEGAGHLVEFADPGRLLRELLTRVRPLATSHPGALR